MKFFSALIQRFGPSNWKLSRKLVIAVVAIVMLLVGAASYGYYFTDRGKELADQRDFDQTLKAVSKLYDLPEEVPVLATVTNKDELTSQSMFADAENGDKVLIYNQAKKVILYRPNTKKIINVATINATTPGAQAEIAPEEAVMPSAPPEEQPEASPSAQEVPTTPVTVVILNGTAISGLTQKVQQQLRDSGVNSTVLVRDNALRRDYEITIIIPLTPAGEAMAPEFEKSLSAKTGTLPEGERTRTTDIIIIAGTDAASL